MCVLPRGSLGTPQDVSLHTNTQPTNEHCRLTAYTQRPDSSSFLPFPIRERSFPAQYTHILQGYFWKVKERNGEDKSVGNSCWSLDQI